MSETRGAWIAFFGAVLAALIGGVFLIVSQRQSPLPPAPPSSTLTELGVMGPLEVGVNRQGMDTSDNGTHADNAETCSNLCRASAGCRAMTYVISLKTCWLKAGVPPPFPPGGPDYVSAVRQ